MKEVKLTYDQVGVLSAYERFFVQATKAAWCSYPGQAAINQMLDVWFALTGHRYPYQPGCPHCLVNLVRDIGNLYFSQKDAVMAERAAEDSAAKEEQIAEQNEKRAVELTEMAAAKRTRKKVNTAKK